jgi:orotate phosphoribosyltransferase
MTQARVGGPHRTERVADLLVKTGAVSFRTTPFFRFTSGVESPIYVDNRRLLGFVSERRTICKELAELAVESCDRQVDAIAGTATAGIAWAAWLSEALSLPMVYVRSEAKAWGQRQAVEGFAPPRARVLLLEDLVFSGGSLIAATEQLRSAGYRVSHCFTIASYELPVAAQRFADLGVLHESLTTIDAALAAAAASGALQAEETDTVGLWLASRRSDGS